MFDIASVGKVHLDKARSPELKNNVPKEAIPALYPAVCRYTEAVANFQAIADDFYSRLQKNHFDVWNNELLKRKGISFYKDLLLAKMLHRY